MSARLPASQQNGAQTETPVSRYETVVAALIYLMSCHRRSGCPKLALYVSRHMTAIALHPDAPPVVRDVCAALRESWEGASTQPRCDASLKETRH